MPGPAAAPTGRTPEAQKTNLGQPSAAAAEPGGDQVEISSTSGQIAQAIAAFGAQHAGRVEALSADYQAGRYQPDSMATGRAIIADAVASREA